jgi:hypothetical protein
MFSILPMFGKAGVAGSNPARGFVHSFQPCFSTNLK